MKFSVTNFHASNQEPERNRAKESCTREKWNRSFYGKRNFLHVRLQFQQSNESIGLFGWSGHCCKLARISLALHARHVTINFSWLKRQETCFRVRIFNFGGLRSPWDAMTDMPLSEIVSLGHYCYISNGYFGKLDVGQFMVTFPFRSRRNGVLNGRWGYSKRPHLLNLHAKNYILGRCIIKIRCTLRLLITWLRPPTLKFKIANHYDNHRLIFSFTFF